MRYPVLNGDNVFVITDKEKSFLDHFIQTGDINDSAKVSGLPVSAVKEFMDSPRIVEYIKLKVTQVARRNDITLDSVLDRLHQIAWGKLKVSRYEMKALEILSNYLRIVKPIEIKQVINNNESPLSKLPDEELNRRLAEAYKEALPPPNGTE